MVRVRAAVLAPVIIVVFVGGIGAAMISGLWITESSRTPMTFTSGEFAGEYNPADIRGSYTFSDIEKSFGIPVEALARAFGVADLENPEDFRAGDLEEMYAAQPDGGEVGTDALRLFVSLYSGLPYLAEETTRLPSPALAELESRLAPADIDAVRELLVPLESLRVANSPAAEEGTAVAIEGDGDSENETYEEHSDNDREIRGRTTFDDLLDWGLTAEQIEETLGMPMGARGETVRDFLAAEGLEFSAYRTTFQEMLETTAEQ